MGNYFQSENNGVIVVVHRGKMSNNAMEEEIYKKYERRERDRYID